jgi:hypothetical protein
VWAALASSRVAFSPWTLLVLLAGMGTCALHLVVSLWLQYYSARIHGCSLWSHWYVHPTSLGLTGSEGMTGWQWGICIVLARLIVVALCPHPSTATTIASTLARVGDNQARTWGGGRRGLCSRSLPS